MLAAMGRLKVVGCPFLGAAQNPHLIACFRCLEDLEVFDLAASELSNRVSPGGRKVLAAGSRCCLYHFVSWTLEVLTSWPRAMTYPWIPLGLKKIHLPRKPVGAPWNQSTMNMSLRFAFFDSHKFALSQGSTLPTNTAAAVPVMHSWPLPMPGAKMSTGTRHCGENHVESVFKNVQDTVSLSGFQRCSNVFHV